MSTTGGFPPCGTHELILFKKEKNQKIQNAFHIARNGNH